MPPPAPPARGVAAPRPVAPPPAPKYQYLVLWKPYGVLSQFTEREGHTTLKGMMPVPGVHPVGRLDEDSEGALIFTDDPAFQRALTKPGSDHGKLYLVQVEREPDEVALGALRNGVVLDGRETLPAEAAVIPEPELPERPVPIRYRKNVPTAWLELVLFEGRNRQVRRMTAAVGHPTLRLVRWAVGPVSLEGMQPGQWRHFSKEELRWAREVAAEGLRPTRARAWQTFAEPEAPVRASGIPFQGGKPPKGKGGGSRGARKPQGRPEGRGEGGPGTKPAGRTGGSKPAGRTEGRREGGPGTKPAGRSGGSKPAGRPEGRREGGPGPKPAGRSGGSKPGGRGSKPGGAKPGGSKPSGAGRKPGGKPGRKPKGRG